MRINVNELRKISDKNDIGDVRTPEELVEEILDKIDKKVFESTSTTFLDPCCGRGAFVLAICKRLEAAGHSVENISKRVFAADIRLKYCNILKKRLAKHGFYITIMCIDSLKYNWNMKFDVIVGNPPFSEQDTSREYTKFKGQGKNLAKAFTLKMLENNASLIAFIQPYGHRTFSPKVEKDYIKKGLKHVINCTSFFPDVAQTLAYFIFEKDSEKLYRNDLLPSLQKPKRSITKYFINQPGKLSRFQYESDLQSSGVVKVFITTGIQKFSNNKDFHLIMQDRSYGKWRVVFNCTTTKTSIGKVLIATPKDVLSKSVHCLAFETEEDAIKYKSYLTSPDISIMLSQVKGGMCNSKKYLDYIPDIESTIK